MRKLAILGLALVPVMSASAQKQMTELSVGIASAGLLHFTGESDTHFNVGGQGLALGFYLSSGMAIEPMASLSYDHFGNGGGSTTNFNIGAGLPIYMKKDWGHTGLFVEPRVGINYEKASDTDSRSQFAFGGSLGTKMKMNDHISTRIEAVVMHGLEKASDGIPSYTSVDGVFSISIFLGH